MIVQELCCFRDILTRCLLQIKKKIDLQIDENRTQFKKNTSAIEEQNQNQSLYVNLTPEIYITQNSMLAILED